MTTTSHIQSYTLQLRTIYTAKHHDKCLLNATTGWQKWVTSQSQSKTEPLRV